MAGFLQELRAEFKSRAPYIIWALLSVVVVIAGPFGTYGTLGLGARIVFWLPVMAFAICVTTTIRAFGLSVLGLRGFPAGSMGIALLVTLVLTLPLYELPALLPVIPVIRPGVAEIALLVWSTAMGVLAFRAALEPQRPAETPKVVERRPDQPRLMRRIETESCDGLLAISVRDHYVDVRTRTGMRSILLRLSDAIDEAQPVQGVQVHRSHWVAWNAISKVEQNGPKVILRLVDGAEVPVSRANLGKLAERGLI